MARAGGRGGLTFNIGRVLGSEYRWLSVSVRMAMAAGPVQLPARIRDHHRSQVQPLLRPDGNGALSVDEVKAWDPNLSPVPVLCMAAVTHP